MSDFQWIVNDFLLRHLSGKLWITLALLLLMIAVTAVLVARELRADRKGD